MIYASVIKTTMMTKKIYAPVTLTTIVSVLLFNLTSVFAQQLPAEFFSGLKAMSVNRAQAKNDMMISLSKMPDFFGAYHFLGVIYSEAQQQDSAIYYLEKAISLNTANVNKTREMSLARLIESYTYKQDFEKAYRTGLEAYKLYPENKAIAVNFKDACIWSYHIKYTGLNKRYLSPVMMDEYVVTSIPQEYLIVRKLIHQGERFQVVGQSLKTIDKSNYDVLKYVTATDKTEKELKFRLNWDMNTEFGGKVFPAETVTTNKENPMYERIGALLVKEPKIDLKAEIEKLK
jgi:tetratricopeptide (TPR) repeat protein